MNTIIKFKQNSEFLVKNKNHFFCIFKNNTLRLCLHVDSKEMLTDFSFSKLNYKDNRKIRAEFGISNQKQKLYLVHFQKSYFRI